MSKDPKQHLVELMSHARKILEEVNKYFVELSSENIADAEKKAQYSRMVMQSLQDEPMKSQDAISSDPELATLMYDSLVSVNPTLLRATEELESRIKEFRANPQPQPQEFVPKSDEFPNNDSAEDIYDEEGDSDDFITGVDFVDVNRDNSPHSDDESNHEDEEEEIESDSSEEEEVFSDN